MDTDLNVNVDMTKMDSVAGMGLLSPELNYYILKEKWWDWGGGDIFNQRGISGENAQTGHITKSSNRSV